MKITITSTHVDEKQWAKEGRSGVIRTQEATAENERFRQTIRLDLGKNDAYPLGIYNLDFEKNVSVGDFGDLKLARKPTLDRVSPLAKAA